jgi:hypothetical protein
MSTTVLTAKYEAPSCTRTFEMSLPPLSSGDHAQSVKDKSAFLNSLRSNIAVVQKEVNTFLTQKMDEEKVEGLSKSDGNSKTREEKEEEMYGEEDPQDDG